VSNHTHSDMRISIGFAVAFFTAFLVAILAPKGITESQIETVWIVAISTGFINHGIWYRERGLVLGVFLSIATTLISLPFALPFFPSGWIILGCAIAVSGFYRAPRTGNLLIGVYITIGGIIRLLSAFFQTSFFLHGWSGWY
jgi:hypothetical protein